MKKTQIQLVTTKKLSKGKSILTLIAATVALGAFAETAQAQVLYSQNFDSLNTGAIGGQGGFSVQSGGPNANVVADPTATSTPNDLQLGSSANIYTTSPAAAFTTGLNYSLSYNVKTLYTNGTSGGDFLFQAQTNDYNDDSYLFRAFVSQSGSIGFYNSSNTLVASGVSITEGDWTSFTYTYNTTTDAEMVTVNDLTAGTTLLSDYAISPVGLTPTSLKLLQLSSDGFGETGAAVSIDDLSFGIVPEPGQVGLMLMGLSVMAILLVRKARSTSNVR